MEENILESNKLIAEFMGIEIVKRNNEDAVYMFKKAAFPEYFRITKYNTYNFDWNELMPVVEKIEYLEDDGQILFSVNTGKDYCIIQTNNFNPKVITATSFPKDKLKSIWQSVVQFIQWYNKQDKLTARPAEK